MPAQSNEDQGQGFTPAQRQELAQMIAAAGQQDSGRVRLEVVNGDQDKPARGRRQRPSDDEWDNMAGDLQRRTVRQLVEEELAAISRDDEVADLRATVEKLKAAGVKPAEKAPTPWEWLQSKIWGAPPK